MVVYVFFLCLKSSKTNTSVFRDCLYNWQEPTRAVAGTFHCCYSDGFVLAGTCLTCAEQWIGLWRIRSLTVLFLFQKQQECVSNLCSMFALSTCIINNILSSPKVRGLGFDSRNIPETLANLLNKYIHGFIYHEIFHTY